MAAGWHTTSHRAAARRTVRDCRGPIRDVSLSRPLHFAGEQTEASVSGAGWVTWGSEVGSQPSETKRPERCSMLAAGARCRRCEVAGTGVRRARERKLRLAGRGTSFRRSRAVRGGDVERASGGAHAAMLCCIRNDLGTSAELYADQWEWCRWC